MKFKEALATFQIGKKKVTPAKLLTPWGEKINPENLLKEYPRPQMRRNSYKSLNGFWEYAFTDCSHMQSDTAFPVSWDGRILVPFSPETILSGVERTLRPDEFLWYKRQFTVDDLMLQNTPDGNGHVLLHFGAVDEETAVWINGARMCEHSGGYLSFTVDITDAVRTDEANTLTVRVRDTTDTSWHNRGKQKLNPGGMFYTAQSGIWQSVWLEYVPEIYIKELKITPLFDESAVLITAFTSFPCLVDITSCGGTFRCNSGTPCRIYVRDMHAWSPEDPHLYDFTAMIPLSGDRVESYFAMRKFSAGRDNKGIPRLFLNNEPYFLNGVLDQGYWSDGLYTAPSDEAMIYDISSMKSLGFNMIRKHIKIEPMRWYYHCDRLGMIVWQDMINGGGRSLMAFLLYLPTTLPFVKTNFPDCNYPLFSRSSERGRRIWTDQCMETIRQLYNCPCIGEWTAFNEGWGQFDSLEIYDLIKRCDHTRIIDHASGWYDQGGGDIRSEHNYFSTLRVVIERRPFCLTEYGGLSLHIDGHSYSSEDFAYEKFKSPEELQKAFIALRKKTDRLQTEGLAAAVYTQVSDVEEEVNGILTFDRRVNKLSVSNFLQ